MGDGKNYGFRIGVIYFTDKDTEVVRIWFKECSKSCSLLPMYSNSCSTQEWSTGMNDCACYLNSRTKWNILCEQFKWRIECI